MLASKRSRMRLSLPILTPLEFSDVTLLADSHEFGARCVRELENSGITVAHIFAKDSRDQRLRKLRFPMSDARVKACTIHSFKGWESRSLVVAIKHATSREQRALVYVALPRLKRHERGSFLTVICATPELEAYGRSWPEFQRLGLRDRAARATVELDDFPF
jgi:hypothetical protein